MWPTWICWSGLPPTTFNNVTFAPRGATSARSVMPVTSSSPSSSTPLPGRALVPYHFNTLGCVHSVISSPRSFSLHTHSLCLPLRCKECKAMFHATCKAQSSSCPRCLRLQRYLESDLQDCSVWHSGLPVAAETYEMTNNKSRHSCPASSFFFLH